MSEQRTVGCSRTERCAPIRRASTGAKRPIATTLTVNTASACASRRLRYGEPALESPRPLIAPQGPQPPARLGPHLSRHCALGRGGPGDRGPDRSSRGQPSPAPAGNIDRWLAAHNDAAGHAIQPQLPRLTTINEWRDCGPDQERTPKAHRALPTSYGGASRGREAQRTPSAYCRGALQKR
jgi:hypothetical protein